MNHTNATLVIIGVSIILISGILSIRADPSYYGSGTFGDCTVDAECAISGCNNEICQSTNELLEQSACNDPEDATPVEVGYYCRCTIQGCDWV